VRPSAVEQLSSGRVRQVERDLNALLGAMWIGARNEVAAEPDVESRAVHTRDLSKANVWR
jgi:hypothetical protein